MKLARFLCFLYVLCGASFCLSLDREAFSITKYDLSLQIEPEQHRLGARGKITLRNDSSTPQKIAVLQISSSLDWRAIRSADKMLQFVTQPLASDIDHTGALSEAVVTLPQEIVPKGTIDLDIAYEGVIVLDTTRLTRIGAPEDVAKNSDWDRIDEEFTAVRGTGYVAWYPIATESASMQESEDLSEVVGRWSARESLSSMSLTIASTKDCTILFSGTKVGFADTPDKPAKIGTFRFTQRSASVPTFVLAEYKTIDVKNDATVNFLTAKEVVAGSYADALGNLDPLQSAKSSRSLQVAQLPVAGATPFVSDHLLLTPLQPLTDESRRTLIYALARQKTASPRTWISEGLAHLAQVLDIEQQQGRSKAVEYLKLHSTLLVRAETRLNHIDAASAKSSASLLNATDGINLQSKAMCVWWMLRDMVGDAAFNNVLSSYQASEDNGSDYMPRLISAHTQHDLSWFFDDWVYHDHGLPDFKVESAFASSTPTKSFLLAVTLSNLGAAGAEVPVTIKFAGGEVTKRIELRAKSKATFRVETPAVPQEIRVNDGSVPEANPGNNTFKVDPPKS